MGRKSRPQAIDSDHEDDVFLPICSKKERKRKRDESSSDDDERAARKCARDSAPWSRAAWLELKTVMKIMRDIPDPPGSPDSWKVMILETINQAKQALKFEKLAQLTESIKGMKENANILQNWHIGCVVFRLVPVQTSPREHVLRR